MLIVVLLIQFAEDDESGHRSSSADSTPDEVDSRLLRKQLLEVCIHVNKLYITTRICIATYSMIYMYGSASQAKN